MKLEQVRMIVLSAGYSTRHPGKLLRDVQGESALARTVRVLCKAGLRPVVVVGERDPLLHVELRPFATQGVRLVENPDPAMGMASSIVAGVKGAGPEVNVFGVHLADKPFVQIETIRTLLALWGEQRPPAMAPRWQGRQGHPVLFNASLRSELLALEGDTGGQGILERLGSRVVYMDVDDEGVVLDMDQYLEMNHE